MYYRAIKDRFNSFSRNSLITRGRSYNVINDLFIPDTKIEGLYPYKNYLNDYLKLPIIIPQSWYKLKTILNVL